MSSLGDDEISTEPYNDALYKVVEHDEHITRLQTITRIETSNNQVRIYGGLGTKISPATHLNYEFILEELSPTQLHFTARIVSRDAPMANYQRLMLVFESHKDEDFYGFGEQFTYGSLKGHKVPIMIRYVCIYECMMMTWYQQQQLYFKENGVMVEEDHRYVCVTTIAAYDSIMIGIFFLQFCSQLCRRILWW